MNCPYFDCKIKGVDATNDVCRTCRRPLKACSQCRHLNRAFCRFCSECGEPMVGGDFDWTGYRGGPRRLGLNPTLIGRSWMNSKLVAVDPGPVELDEACFDLLSWDRHLVAIGESGRVEIRAPGAASGYSLQVGEGLSCHSCVEGARLFVGRDGVLAAYSLGALTLPRPKTSPVWSVTLPGRPMGSLLVIRDRLVAKVEAVRGVGVVILDHVFDQDPPKVRWLHPPSVVSPIAGDRNTSRVHFLSAQDGRICIHTVQIAAGATPMSVYPVPDLQGSELSRVPLAVMGKNLFAVLGEDGGLYRLEPGQPTIRLDTDIRKFGLNRGDQRVLLQTTGWRFPHGQKVELAQMEQVVGHPVILRNFALAAGLRDGRIVIYDLNNPPYHQHERLGDHAISALASFGPYLAAGTEHGTVAIFQVVPS